VIVSEQHDILTHQQNQLRVLESLFTAGANHLSVGMEFFYRPSQPQVDQFVNGLIGEAEFLKSIEWGKAPFASYRPQVLFPRTHGGKTLALNASRSLTGRISKVGIAGLTDAERAQLPPNFTLGNAAYFERFQEVMSGHISKEALQRFFEAQSVWDETMAWTATEYLKEDPKQILVIIVGDFHAVYGGGLPDRLLARGAKKVVVVSQVHFDGVSESEAEKAMKPHEKWGPRADFIWVSR
jgi:uncharacterized iron-regulated protein